VALSSTLLFVWALGAAIGPTTGTYAIQLIAPRAFFAYVIALTLAFTLFAVWRLYRRKLDRVIEVREEFLTYPQTSPEIYAWLPYHRETPGEALASAATASAATAVSATAGSLTADSTTGLAAAGAEATPPWDRPLEPPPGEK